MNVRIKRYKINLLYKIISIKLCRSQYTRKSLLENNYIYSPYLPTKSNLDGDEFSFWNCIYTREMRRKSVLWKAIILEDIKKVMYLRRGGCEAGFENRNGNRREQEALLGKQDQNKRKLDESSCWLKYCGRNSEEREINDLKRKSRENNEERSGIRNKHRVPPVCFLDHRRRRCRGGV